MPKEIKDLKVFMNKFTLNTDLGCNKNSDEIHRPKNTFKKSLTVKKNKRITKFKLRTKRYLYTFKTHDAKIIKKILKNLPS